MARVENKFGENVYSISLLSGDFTLAALLANINDFKEEKWGWMLYNG